MQYICTTSPAVASSQYCSYNTCGSNIYSNLSKSPLPTITSISRHDSEKRGTSKKDPRPQFQYRVLVRGQDTK